MDAIILVGGQGTRLRPLTLTRHKSLVPVANQPAIDHLLDWLSASGIERVVLALGQHNEDLADACPEGRRGSLTIVHVLERERLESGGAIRNAVREAGVEGRFLVLNGDVYADFDLSQALAAHVEAKARLTLALWPVTNPSAFGVAVVDDASIVTGFVEKPPPGTEQSNLVNAGVWVFEPGLVDEIAPGPVSVEHTLFPSLVGRGAGVLGYRFEGLWADLGTPARYLDLSCALAKRAGTSFVADGASLAGDASAVESAVGAGCVIEAGATLRHSVLWENVGVGAGARVSNTILADGVTIGDGAVVQGAVLGSGASVAAGATVPAGTLIDPNGRFE